MVVVAVIVVVVVVAVIVVVVAVIVVVVVVVEILVVVVAVIVVVAKPQVNYLSYSRSYAIELAPGDTKSHLQYRPDGQANCQKIPSCAP